MIEAAGRFLHRLRADEEALGDGFAAAIGIRAFARRFVEHDEGGRVGRADAFVGVVHAISGVEIEMIAVNEN